ncbi:ATPase domain protein, prokaryote domain protein, partial [Candidatus Thiomargarita nelsonii]
MQYPLTEKIGHPELLVGREKEFRQFDKWLSLIPNRMSKSRVILARRKSGKTVFVQRIFNRLWSEPNRGVIPFYFDIAENKAWYPDFAVDYYRTFASQYISFIQRDEQLVNQPLTLEEIRDYGLANSNKRLVSDVNSLLKDKEMGLHDSMWKTAYSAPHRFAALFETRFLVILDEFQNITQYIYPDQQYQTR